MKTFKQLFEEIKWRDKTWQFVIDHHIPLSPKMFERLFENPKKVKSLHITNYKNFKKLEKLQGTKKSISSGREFHHSTYLYGVQGGGGIVSVVEGVPLLTWHRDAWTKPDESGRRWIDSNYLLNRLPVESKKYHWQTFETICEYFEDLRNQAVLKYAKPYSDETEYQFMRDLQDSVLKSKIIKQYFDLCEKYIKNHLNEFTLFFNTLENVKVRNGDWSELVLYNVKIKKVYLMNKLDDTVEPEVKLFKGDSSLMKKYKPETVAYMQFSKRVSSGSIFK